MRKLILAVVLVLVASEAQASSYLDILGVVHDPIMTTSGAVHSYSGPNLPPNANPTGADLSYADLFSGWFAYTNLTDTNLSGAYPRNQGHASRATTDLIGQRAPKGERR